ncbi:MAG TPA: toast rack family protein [Atribacterota bacterium]|nr:toast rack family protein [Atribacterota bacterium]
MKANKIIKGLTFLLIGIILLANTLEILEWSVWSNIIKLWPLLLVSLGISLIFRGRGLAFLGPLIVFLGVIAGVGASYMGFSFEGLEGEMLREVKTLSREIVMEVEKNPETEAALKTEVAPDTGTTLGTEVTPETETAPDTETPLETEAALETKAYPEIERASIALDLDVGKLSLVGSTSLLYECTAQYRYKEFEPFEKFSRTGKENDIVIYHLPITKKWISNHVRNDWQLKLNNQIIYELSAKTGVIDTDFNLSGFKVEKLTIKSGVSNINLVLPQYDSEIMIDSGVSNIKINIPKNVGATVNIDSGISAKDLDINDFTKKDDTYISNNYNYSEFKTTIEIDCGVSNIEVNYINIP